jgi:hypothetical protein
MTISLAPEGRHGSPAEGLPVPPVRALRPESGTRARSRQIGYAEAMTEMWTFLRDLEKKYKADAASAGSPAEVFTFAYIAWALGEVAGYAFDASLIHGDQRGVGHGIEGWMEFIWRQGDAPQERSTR